jgi:chemotaxis signal transduction protein
MSAPVIQTLQERLEAVRVASARDARRTPEAARALLASRARLLARPAAAPDDSEAQQLDLLLVQVGVDRLAIPMLNVVAIARTGSVAPLPRAVLPVYGVTAWRGRPLTVLSLAGTRPVWTPDTRLVVLGTGARAALAVLVDAVDDVTRVGGAELSPAGPGPRHAYALGITTDGVLVVSGDALLQPETITT